MFISGENPHRTSRFCGVVLGPTTISKNMKQPLPKNMCLLQVGTLDFQLLLTNL